MAWQDVLDAIDAVESWIVLLPLYAQIPLLLVVLLPLTWLLSRLIDPAVEWVLRWHGVARGGRRPGPESRDAAGADGGRSDGREVGEGR